MRRGAAVAVPAVVLEQRRAQRPVRGALQAAVDRGHDLVAGAVQLLAVHRRELLAHHLRDVRCVDLDLRAVLGGLDRRDDRLVVLGLPDVALLEHAAQHVAAALARAVGVGDRVQRRRCLRQRRDRGDLGERQVAQVLAVVDLGRGTDAVGALAEEDLVQVEGQDLVLGELVLDPEREEDLAQLAAQLLLGREEHVAGELHRDRAAALACLVGRGRDDHGAQQAGRVDAAVREEPVVLGGDERVDDMLRDVLEAHRDATLLADLREQAAIARVDAQRHLQPDVAQLRDLGQRRREIVVDGEAADRDGTDQAHRKARQHREHALVNRLHRNQTQVFASCGVIMHSSRGLMANPPKGGDAKLPV